MMRPLLLAPLALLFCACSASTQDRVASSDSSQLCHAEAVVAGERIAFDEANGATCAVAILPSPNTGIPALLVQVGPDRDALRDWSLAVDEVPSEGTVSRASLTKIGQFLVPAQNVCDLHVEHIDRQPAALALDATAECEPNPWGFTHLEVHARLHGYLVGAPTLVRGTPVPPPSLR